MDLSLLDTGVAMRGVYLRWLLYRLRALRACFLKC
jgi:hypothetical protein